MQEGLGENGYFADWEIASIRKRRKPVGIFICSTYEIFHPDTAKKLDGESISGRDKIFMTIEDCPQHRFYILTKFPQNIDREIPDNIWLGVTITSGDTDMWRLIELMKHDAKIRFVSFEPLLYPILFHGVQHVYSNLNWVIVGRLTQHGKKYNPTKWSIKRIVDYSKYYGVPVFMKDNLQDIWGPDLIQEMPKE